MILTPFNHPFVLSLELALFTTIYITYLLIGSKIWHNSELEMLEDIDRKIDLLLNK